MNNINGLDAKQSVTRNIDVTDEKRDNRLKLLDCHSVTDEKVDTEKGIKESDVPQWKQLRFESEEDYLKMINN